MSLSRRARAMKAANPSLTIKQIADELFCEEKTVRVALKSMDREEWLKMVSKKSEAKAS